MYCKSFHKNTWKHNVAMHISSNNHWLRTVLVCVCIWERDDSSDKSLLKVSFLETQLKRATEEYIKKDIFTSQRWSKEIARLLKNTYTKSREENDQNLWQIYIQPILSDTFLIVVTSSDSNKSIKNDDWNESHTNIYNILKMLQRFWD